ncbi:HAMP domain-containing sensor histidine kinase [Virgibacillus necropolis]|uniref:histidine kinase n=1 Tax=Virgibacillus necropolis TaxID=163877 RepID=A0A221M8D9_9BACI|nr:HAMP domain-containing sensor histidine kinase [Virgibacillus necropolis]ASN03913.1 two-component sensor histidine kinase [Virgibacillus necropolis]
MFNKKSWLPKQFLWRLTLLNVVIVAFFIAVSCWAIYNTACFLVDGFGTMNEEKQNLFNSTLFHYLCIFSITAIVMSSMIHFYLTKQLIRPIRKLIQSTKVMKRGQYPKPIEVSTKDETGQLISQFNDLIMQLKNNELHRQKLVSDLSHEFRTPLTNLNGYLRALKDGMIDGNPELYESLYKESKRLTNMVQQIEQLKEWDNVSQQTYSEKEAVDMALLIKQSVEMFRWSLKKENITVNIQTENIVVDVNSEGISQVVSNLVGNAILYYQGTDSITIKGKTLESDYYFSVEGPGQPIPIEDQDKIFQRFYRVDQSRDRETGGTGLGLAISKEIVEHHKGTIGMESVNNHHIFWFTLPFQKVNS